MTANTKRYVDSTAYSRRAVLKMIGCTAGLGAMLSVMGTLGIAPGPSEAIALDLQGAPKGSSVLILGAGVAGLIAAYELRKAGYKVKILEYQDRPGGRAKSVYQGSVFTDINGVKQTCQFAPGQYLNVGPWRIPYHHQNTLAYCKMFGVTMEPFLELNFNSYVYSDTGGGVPRRFREVFTDFNGYLTELLAKAVNTGQLNDPIVGENKELLLEALKTYGILDKNYRYEKSIETSDFRGYEKPVGGGLSGRPVPSEPITFKDLLESKTWGLMRTHFAHEFQQTMFEPKGGMEKMGQAFAQPVKDIIEFGAEVVAIRQNERQVEVDYNKKGDQRTEKADWCVCTIPLPMLRRVSLQVNDKLQQAINAVPYEHVVKVGAQYKRRFWEQDDHIYGGVSITTQPNAIFSYPSDIDNFFGDGKGVLLNAYMFQENGKEFMGMTPEQRIDVSLGYLEKIHPQVRKEYENGFSMPWDLVPWIRGAYSLWTDELREQHYKSLCEIDNRLVLAGEHASYIPGWFEGAITSTLDAIARLHDRASKS